MAWLSNLVNKAKSGLNSFASSYRNTIKPAKKQEVKPVSEEYKNLGDLDDINKTAEIEEDNLYERLNSYRNSTDNLCYAINNLENAIGKRNKKGIENIIDNSLRELVYGKFDKGDEEYLEGFSETYTDIYRKNLLGQNDKKALLTLDALARMQSAYVAVKNNVLCSVDINENEKEKIRNAKSFSDYLLDVVKNSEPVKGKTMGDILVNGNKPNNLVTYRKDNLGQDSAYVNEYGTLHKNIIDKIFLNVPEENIRNDLVEKVSVKDSARSYSLV